VGRGVAGVGLHALEIAHFRHAYQGVPQHVALKKRPERPVTVVL
jgi:hypothetical protein